VYYNPGLAEAEPRIIPLGREFQLARDAKWSDGQRVTVADVRQTVNLLKAPNLTGRVPEWAKLVDDPRVEGNPFQIQITLRNGFLDPLSLMTFKVLPSQVRGKRLAAAEDEDFAKSPLGSGPFQYDRTEAKGDSRHVVFTANPFYQRASRPGRPRIREIRFFVSKDPAKDLEKGQLQLLLDLPSSRVRELIKAGFKEEDIRTLPSRRVYFLAVNHQNEALQNQDLRKAIAHAIDRETLLKDHFRAGYLGLGPGGKLVEKAGPVTEPLHPVLNGPYPAGSWACAPPSRVPTHLFDPSLARTKAKQALAKLHPVDLKLAYPAGDIRVQKACEDICAQVAGLGEGIKIKPVGMSPHEFCQAITKRKYDLAYCHYDYASDAYWLWPLFDPDKSARDPGGSNFLRYENDDVLASFFRKAMNHRDFSEVQKLTHDIHAHLHDKMPLIPLWQLHTHIAVHPDLEVVGLDPLLVFSNAEEWRLKKR
jgi:ABC-type transport system substrate-binding protein